MSLTRKNTLITLSWAVINTIQFFLRNIFFISLFLKLRSGQDYGFWIILMSFYGPTMYVVDGYVRYCLNEYNLEFYKNSKAAGSQFRNGFTFLLAVSVAVLIIFFALIQYLPLSASVFNTTVETIGSYQLHYCLLIAMALSLGSSLVRYISGAIEPEGKIHINSRFITLYGICETLLYFTCIWLGSSFITLFIVLAIVLFSMNGVYLYSLFRKHSVYSQGLLGNVPAGFRLFLRSILFLTNNFFEKLTAEGINFIVTIFYPLVSLAAYASTRTMANVMLSTGNMFISVFTIEFQRLKVNKDGDRLLKIFHSIWLAMGLCINFGLVLCYPLLIRIYTLWTHDKLPVNSLFFFMIFSVIVLNIYGTVIILYLKSLNAVRQILPVSIARAAMIFLLAVLLPKGAVYLAFALLVSDAIVNVLLLNLFLHKELKALGCASPFSALFWNVIPFIITAAYLPLNSFLQAGYILTTGLTAGLLCIVYILQLRHMKNNLLAQNLVSVIEKLRPGPK